MSRINIVGMIGQWCGLLSVIAGCGIEFKYHADVGFVLITLGSLLFAVGTKLHHYTKKEDRK